MPLLPEELKTRLPKLDSQKDELDPVVYAGSICRKLRGISI